MHQASSNECRYRCLVYCGRIYRAVQPVSSSGPHWVDRCFNFLTVAFRHDSSGLRRCTVLIPPGKQLYIRVGMLPYYILCPNLPKADWLCKNLRTRCLRVVGIGIVHIWSLYALGYGFVSECTIKGVIVSAEPLTEVTSTSFLVARLSRLLLSNRPILTLRL